MLGLTLPILIQRLPLSPAPTTAPAKIGSLSPQIMMEFSLFITFHREGGELKAEGEKTFQIYSEEKSAGHHQK